MYMCICPVFYRAGSLQHLSGNLFNVLVFGRLIEETEGSGGVWAIYLLTGLGETQSCRCPT